ncbi:putative inner membrane protein [Oxobacter pfennigii]|uniref:Putative inner membrane protein n=1 Tax=Oxobacter pfennigii TaxID=36849 RepID=A0A0P8WRU6_9CLOT|nr:putative inner membrane protein [Oxobacter pfennigii]
MEKDKRDENMNIEKKHLIINWLKKPWSYVTGAVLLSILQIITLYVTKEPWGVSKTFANWGAWIYEALGGNLDKWYYFENQEAREIINNGFIKDPGSIRNLGIILGSLLSALLASQFKIRKAKSKKQIIAAMIGGLLMGYGARITFGCNIGALYSGISSLSVSGWVYIIFVFIGAVVGGKLLLKFFI